MYYAPHQLFKREEYEQRDSLNRITAAEYRWVYVCDCRCDDNTTQKFEDDNGRVFVPNYKIVCERADIKEGDYIQCRTKGSVGCHAAVRAEGRVVNAPKCNYLNYMVAYV